MSLTTLYRFYDADDRLLYIGISERGPERWKAHRKDKPWWGELARTTTEHYETRAEALEAERAAIIAEKPLHNVVHNRGRTDTTTATSEGIVDCDPCAAEAVSQLFDTDDIREAARKRDRLLPVRDRPHDRLKGERRWRMMTSSGHLLKSHLWLTWEVAGDPISDNYTPADISAFDLLWEWAQSIYRDGGDPFNVPIHWFIEGDAGIFEYAPGAPNNSDVEDFSTHYRYVRRPRGGRGYRGEPLTPDLLPIIDKLWGGGRADKGGFIQSATGWKPYVYQSHVNASWLMAEAKRRTSERAS